MFDRVTVRVTDLAASERFYATVLAALGLEPARGRGSVAWGEFSIAAADAGHPPTRGLHIGFAAAAADLVDAFWRAGVDAGHPDDGAPGPRPAYGPDYYGGFLRDPDGNSAEAARTGPVKHEAAIDHLWLRVADPDASAAFYERLAPFSGFEPRPSDIVRLQLRSPSGVSFSVLGGEPRTEHVHLAFASRDGDAGVRAVHEALIEAGYRDGGAPSERPGHQPGHYGASVLDPDGSTVEVVEHHRS